MIGGEDSFGVGGYYQTPVEDALPVYMDVRRKQSSGAGDGAGHRKSGSMGMTMLGASRRSAWRRRRRPRQSEVLNPQDEIGVICFDEATKEVVKLRKATNKRAITDKIAQIRSGGGTQMYGAMDLAYGG